jgi:hypothetical protein
MSSFLAGRRPARLRAARLPSGFIAASAGIVGILTMNAIRGRFARRQPDVNRRLKQCCNR